MQVPTSNTNLRQADYLDYGLPMDYDKTDYAVNLKKRNTINAIVASHLKSIESLNNPSGLFTADLAELTKQIKTLETNIKTTVWTGEDDSIKQLKEATKARAGKLIDRLVYMKKTHESMVAMNAALVEGNIEIQNYLNGENDLLGKRLAELTVKVDALTPEMINFIRNAKGLYQNEDAFKGISASGLTTMYRGTVNADRATLVDNLLKNDRFFDQESRNEASKAVTKDPIVKEDAAKLAGQFHNVVVVSSRKEHQTFASEVDTFLTGLRDNNRQLTNANHQKQLKTQDNASATAERLLESGQNFVAYNKRLQEYAAKQLEGTQLQAKVTQIIHLPLENVARRVNELAAGLEETRALIRTVLRLCDSSVGTEFAKKFSYSANQYMADKWAELAAIAPTAGKAAPAPDGSSQAPAPAVTDSVLDADAEKKKDDN